jgi:hypothetical protein
VLANQGGIVVVRKALALGVVAVAIAVGGGCSRDEEVKAAAAEMKDVAGAVTKAAAGEKAAAKAADAAAKVLKDKLPGLKTKFEAVKDVRGFEVKDETTQELAEAVATTTMDVCGLKLKYVMELVEDTPANKQTEQQFDDMCDDWGAALGGKDD